MLHVEPYEVLEIVVGSGGSAGVSGTEIEFIGEHVLFHRLYRR